MLCHSLEFCINIYHICIYILHFGYPFPDSRTGLRGPVVKSGDS